MTTVWPALRLTLETLIVPLAALTVPTLEVVYPARLLVVVCGDVQPVGTSTVTVPFVMPPVGAVYVIVSVAVLPASTGDGETETVPLPSAALLTVTEGWEARLVSVPPAVDFCFVVHVAAPVVVVTTPPA